MDKKSFIFFGRSGAGKGTQAKLIVDYLQKNDPDRGTVYIETGAEFRKFMNEPSYTGKHVKEVLDEGGLLPEFLPIWVWTSVLVSKFTGNEHLVFDGISRRTPEAPVVDGALDFFEMLERYIVYINVSRKWAKERLLERGRGDDNEDDIEARLDWYEENVAPVVEIFRNNSKYTFLDINGEQSIEKVQQDIVNQIKK